MPASELVQWTAFEQVFGPILPHERIDFGFALLSYYLVSVFSQKRRKLKVRDFLPKYMRDLVRHQPADPDQLRTVFQGLVDADNLDPNGRHSE